VLLRTSNGHEVEHALDSSDWAIVARTDLGRALLERALDNSRVHHIRQKVTGLEQSSDGWYLRTSADETFSADFVVGADGVRSIVRRQVVGPIPRQHLALAVGYRGEGALDAVIFQTYADLEGYLWSFPRADHASVGICAPTGAIPAHDLWQRIDQFLAEMCPEAVKQDRYAALLPMAYDASLWDTPCAGPGWALLGDAASHVHPLTGECIAYALWSAELLAEAVARGEPQVYDSLWWERYGNGLVAAGEMLGPTKAIEGAYEVMFQLGLEMALPGPD
jgi:flavin-dependent dehydrogenase